MCRSTDYFHFYAPLSSANFSCLHEIAQESSSQHGNLFCLSFVRCAFIESDQLSTLIHHDFKGLCECLHFKRHDADDNVVLNRDSRMRCPPPSFPRTKRHFSRVLVADRRWT